MLAGTRVRVTRAIPLAAMPASAKAFRVMHARRKPARPLRAAIVVPTVAAAAPATQVTITVEHRTDFGQVLKVVGSGPALGDWNPKDAPALEWTDGDVWVAALDLPAGASEFKLVVASADSAVWEGGANRTINVPAPTRDASAGYLLACDWGCPGKTVLEPAGPETVPTDSEDEAEVSVADSKGDLSGVDDDDAGRAPVAPAAAAPAASKQPADKFEEAEEVVEMGTGPTHVSARNDLVDSGVGAEEGSSAAAAMTPEVAQAMASSDEDDLESPLKQAVTGLLKGLGFKSDDDSAGPSSGGGGKAGAARATPLAATMVAVGAAAAIPAIPAPPSAAPGALSRLFTWPAAAEEANSLSATTSANPAAPEVAPVDLGSADASAAADAPADASSGAVNEEHVDADSSSTIEEFRERLRWLNAVTAAAQEELNAIAPPPLKSALDGAVRTVKETDVGPAVEVVKRVVGDLQEGFSGLFSAAKDFDAATTTAELKARMDKELEMRKAEEDARAAAAASAAAAAAEQAAASAPAPSAAPAPGPPAPAQ